MNEMKGLHRLTRILWFIIFPLPYQINSSAEQERTLFGIPDFFGENEALRQEAKLDTINFILKNGYPAEFHKLTTSDGYHLTLHRIPYGKTASGNKSRNPVLLQHGFSCTSRCFVDNNEDSLAFILADQGYDVWLGNVRGNNYSLGHDKYPLNSEEYWNFSWDEIAEYDMPAMIDFILNATNFKQLVCIGHSQGTTVLFALLSSKTEYHEKVKGFIAMAPVTYLAHSTPPGRLFAYRRKLIKFVLEDVFHMYSLFLPNALVKDLLFILCPSYMPVFCEIYLFLTSGIGDWAIKDSSRLPLHMLSCPFGGMSFKTLYHWAQLMTSKRFQYYDYGEKGNEKMYGTTQPPEYNMSNVKVPVAIFRGDSDPLADPDDVANLASHLPKVISNNRCSNPKFSHSDFLWGKNVRTLVYDILLNQLSAMWQT